MFLANADISYSLYVEYVCPCMYLSLYTRVGNIVVYKAAVVEELKWIIIIETI